MQHFQGLELAKTNEDSGANALGDAIRRYLRDLYKVDSFGIYLEQNDSEIEVETS